MATRLRASDAATWLAGTAQAPSDELSTQVAAAWGDPVRVPLGPVLDQGLPGESVPALPDELAQFAIHVDVWRVDDRFVCLGVGQHDKELPVVLFAAVSDHWLPPGAP